MKSALVWDFTQRRMVQGCW